MSALHPKADMNQTSLNVHSVALNRPPPCSPGCRYWAKLGWSRSTRGHEPATGAAKLERGGYAAQSSNTGAGPPYPSTP